MQNMPTLGQMMGQNKQAEQKQQSKIDVRQGTTKEMSREGDLTVIVAKITTALRQQGYYELPENEGKENEIREEILAVANAIVNGDAETLKASKIYAFITQKAGQMQAVTGTPESGVDSPESGPMPPMEGM